MRLALAQYALTADTNENLNLVLRLMRAASQRRAGMIIFPELCLSPFFPRLPGRDASSFLTTIDADCIRQIQAACKDLGLAASPNVYLEEGARRFDASPMISAEGKIQGISKMVHIAQVPGFYEQDYYTPSDTGFKTYDTALGRIGVVICFDRHYPESIRTCTLRGAELIIIPTANTVGEPLDIFEYELRVAAMQNGVPIAMCNRVGREGETEFCGESIVVDSDGNVVEKAGRSETLMVVDIDLSHIATSRRNRPYLALRRPETYEP